MRQNPDMKGCPHKLLCWVRSHLLKIKVDSLTGSLWCRNPLGHFNLLKSFLDVQFARWADCLSYLHSTLLGLCFYTVLLLLYQEVRCYPKSERPQAFLGEGGQSAKVRSMNSTRHPDGLPPSWAAQETAGWFHFLAPKGAGSTHL